jgi:membrane dipeptidase
MLKLALGALLMPLAVTAVVAQSDPMLERARKLLAESPVIDGHNDLPWEIRNRAQGDLDKLDVSQRQPSEPQPALMTDIPRLKAGGVGGQFWSVYVPVTMTGADATAATLEQIDIVHRLIAKYPKTFALALTADDVERAQDDGKIASLIGVEGGHCINGSLAVLRMFYALGARYMTLTHTSNTPWADSATDTPLSNGLSPFGESVVREMNRLGMLVDISHVSDATFYDAVATSTSPVIASHSSARALDPAPRDLTDDQLRAVARNGGVVNVNFYAAFIDSTYLRKKTEIEQRIARETDAELKRAGVDSAAVRAKGDQRTNELVRALTPPPLSVLIDHIDHVAKVAGIDHVGLGSDFDGVSGLLPAGMNQVTDLPRIVDGLLARGYSEQAVKQILGGNMLRVMEQVFDRRTAPTP